MLLKNILLLSQTNRGIVGAIYIDENKVKYKGVKGGKIERISEVKTELSDNIVKDEFEKTTKKFIISGGSTGDVLTKSSNNNHDVKWAKPSVVNSKINSYMPSGW